MMAILKDFKVAVLIADGFEEVEMTQPTEALEKEGAIVKIISPSKNLVKSWKFKDWGNDFPVDIDLKSAKAESFDALLLPGGVINPDTLRITPGAVEFVQHFVKANKPIASICHGPWTLINAQAVKGKKMTSWPSLEADLENAGANWVNEQVVRDGKLVTSRKPDDIPAFNKTMIELFAESKLK